MKRLIRFRCSSFSNFQMLLVLFLLSHLTTASSPSDAAPAVSSNNIQPINLANDRSEISINRRQSYDSYSGASASSSSSPEAKPRESLVSILNSNFRATWAPKINGGLKGGLNYMFDKFQPLFGKASSIDKIIGSVDMRDPAEIAADPNNTRSIDSRQSYSSSPQYSSQPYPSSYASGRPPSYSPYSYPPPPPPSPYASASSPYAARTPYPYPPTSYARPPTSSYYPSASYSRPYYSRPPTPYAAPSSYGPPPPTSYAAPPPPSSYPPPPSGSYSYPPPPPGGPVPLYPPPPMPPGSYPAPSSYYPSYAPPPPPPMTAPSTSADDEEEEKETVKEKKERKAKDKDAITVGGIGNLMKIIGGVSFDGKNIKVKTNNISDVVPKRGSKGSSDSGPFIKFGDMGKISLNPSSSGVSISFSKD